MGRVGGRRGGRQRQNDSEQRSVDRVLLRRGHFYDFHRNPNFSTPIQPRLYYVALDSFVFWIRRIRIEFPRISVRSLHFECL